MRPIESPWLYTDEELLFKKTVREFIETELEPTWQDGYNYDTHYDWYHEAIRKLGEQGLFLPSAPEEIGGLGMGDMPLYIVTEEVARVNGGLGIHAGSQPVFAILMSRVMPEAFEKYGRDILEGKLVVACATNSPEGQNNFPEQADIATIDGDEWVLNGEKAFSSGGTIADVMIIQGLYKGTQYLWVTDAKNTPGMTVIANPEMGCSPDYATLSLENVRLPLSHGAETGDVYDRVPHMKPQGKGATLRVAYLALGAAGAAFDQVVEYLKHRTYNFKPIASIGSVQYQIAQLKAKLEAARALTVSASRALERRDPDCITQVSLAKAFTCDVAAEVCYESIQLYGCTGYNPLTGVERHLRDTVGFSIGRSGSQQHYNTAAKYMGLPGCEFECN